MNITQKQRIIGAIVLIALALIIILFLMDNSANSQQKVTINTNIPTPPQITVETSSNTADNFQATTVANATTEQPGGEVIIIKSLNGANSDTSTDQSLANDKSTPQPIAKKQPQKITITPAPKKASSTKSKLIITKKKPAKAANKAVAGSVKDAWVVQLGSFGKRSNAEVLISKLRAQGYTAYLQNIITSNGTITRVNVGPVIERQQATNLIAGLSKKFNMTGIVLRYNPAKS